MTPTPAPAPAPTPESSADAAEVATREARTIRSDVEGVTGHLTGIGGGATAARDGNGIRGVAPDATLPPPETSAPDLRSMSPTSGPVPEAFGSVSSDAFAIEGAQAPFGRPAMLGPSSPPTVEGARATMPLPVSHDIASGTPAATAAAADPAPAAREPDPESGRSTAPTPVSALRPGVAPAFDAGHVRDASDTAAFVALSVR